MNPFYSGSPIPDLSPTILGLGQLAQRKNEMLTSQGLRETEMANTARHQGVIESQGQQWLDLQKRKLPASQQNFSPSDVLPWRATFTQKGYDKALAPVLDRIESWGPDKNVTKGVAANTLATQWDTFFKPEAIKGLQDEYMKRAKNNPNFIGSPEETEIKGMIDTFTQMNGELAKKAFFPSVAEEEMNSKAALAAMRAEQKPTILPSGAIALDAKGNVIKRNPRPANEKLVPVIDENGDTVYVPTSQAANKKVGTKPAAAKVIDPATAAVMEALGIKSQDSGTSKEMSTMPDPVTSKDRTIKDTVTGKRYKSNGKTWLEIK